MWLFRVAWILFAVSLALPVLHVTSSYTYGWEAAVTIAHVEWESVTQDGVTKIFSSDNLSAKYALSGVLSFFQLTLMNGANLLLLLSPLTLWRSRRGKGTWLKNSFAVMCVAAWIVPFDDSGFLVGCYVWCASMMLMFIARRVTWRVVVAMVAVALMFGVAIWLEKLNL